MCVLHMHNYVFLCGTVGVQTFLHGCFTVAMLCMLGRVLVAYNIVTKFDLSALLVYLLKYRSFMIGLSWAGGGDWDYTQTCMCSHTACSEFDFDCGLSMLYIDCYTWTVIKLSAKNRIQTCLIVVVFISSYVTHLSFFCQHLWFYCWE